MPTARPNDQEPIMPSSLARRRLTTRLEQFRQARDIHGGLTNMCLAALGVRLARVPIPGRRLRGKLFRAIYGAKYPALDECELERPLEDFKSFNALFTRGIRAELRPLPADPDQFVCPCDSTVQEVGRIGAGMTMTVKQIEYSLESLLPRTDVSTLDAGHFAVFFLSPRDCHRVFAPYDGALEEVLHIPGSRLLVHGPYQRREYPVFTLNERVVLKFATRMGVCILVLVAGWGVGNVTLPIDPGFRPRGRRITRRTYRAPLPVGRGDWVATFELGSTAILFLKPNRDVTTEIHRDDKVRYGQPAYSIGPPRDKPA